MSAWSRASPEEHKRVAEEIDKAFDFGPSRGEIFFVIVCTLGVLIFFISVLAVVKPW